MGDEGRTSKNRPPILDDLDEGNSRDSEVVLMVRTIWESQCERGFLEHIIFLQRGGGGEQSISPTKW